MAILVAKISNDKQDNTWYDGQDIAVFERGNRRIVVVAEGEIRINIYNKGGKHISTIGNANIDDLERYGIHNDTDIEKAVDEGLLEFENNGWFGLHTFLNGEYMEGDLDASFNYDYAVAYAEKMIEKNEYWEQFER